MSLLLSTSAVSISLNLKESELCIRLINTDSVTEMQVEMQRSSDYIFLILFTDPELEARREQDVPAGMDKPQVKVSLLHIFMSNYANCK